MRVVSVSRLKSHLSQYLRGVKRGGEVQVLDRGVPVARLIGSRTSGQADDRARHRLVRLGVIRPGTGDCSWILSSPRLRLPAADLSGALQEEREDRA